MNGALGLLRMEAVAYIQLPRSMKLLRLSKGHIPQQQR
jgi:hypothetical protein